MTTPTVEQLRESFEFNSGGPNPYYRCKECGQIEPGLLEYLSTHWLTHNEQESIEDEQV